VGVVTLLGDEELAELAALRGLLVNFWPQNVAPLAL
jgi:hypothetical protein